MYFHLVSGLYDVNTFFLLYPVSQIIEVKEVNLGHGLGVFDVTIVLFLCLQTWENTGSLDIRQKNRPYPGVRIDE